MSPASPRLPPSQRSKPRMPLLKRAIASWTWRTVRASSGKRIALFHVLGSPSSPTIRKQSLARFSPSTRQAGPDAGRCGVRKAPALARPAWDTRNNFRRHSRDCRNPGGYRQPSNRHRSTPDSYSDSPCCSIGLHDGAGGDGSCNHSTPNHSQGELFLIDSPHGVHTVA